MAFVNKTSSNKFHSLNEMREHFQQETLVTTQNEMAISNNKSSGDDDSNSESIGGDSSSRNKTKPKAKQVTKKRPLANFHCEDDSEDSGNSSNNNKKPKAKKWTKVREYDRESRN